MEQNKIIINTHQATYFINHEDIIMIKAIGAYSEIICKDTSIKASKSIKHFESILKDLDFFQRIERSLILNKRYITNIIKDKTSTDNSVTFSNGLSILLSKKFTKRIIF